jgi:hypothetical protein
MGSWRDLRSRDPYYASWAGYRQIARAGHLRWLAVLPAMAVAVVLLELGDRVGLWAVPLAVIAFPPVVEGLLDRLLAKGEAQAQKSIAWPCPRCAKPFLRGPTGSNGFARRCLNCGLPKWSPRDPQGGMDGPAVDHPSYGSAGRAD